MVGAAGSLAGQRASMQFRFHTIAILADESLIGVGGGVGYQPIGRVGFRGNVSLGRRRNADARIEMLATYHLDPRKMSGPGAYVLGGLSVETAPVAQFIVLGLGVEQSPGGKSGWFGELGFGGGLRVMVGYRVHPGPVR